MNDKKRQAEAEIVKEAVSKLDGHPTKDDDVEAIRKKMARAAELSPSSAIRMGRNFLKETDPKKH
ncbi:MAG: hypothetical protein WC843_02020 [Candidatus Gracilibacteria bacterium]|jgi:hypothetical protein